MIAHAKSQGPRRVPKWHAAFLAMLPTIIRYAKASFRDHDSETREDLVQECVANCVVASARLVERGKQSIAYPTVLAMYAVRQIKDGWRVGKKANVRDVYDIHARVKGGHQLKHIGSPQEEFLANRNNSIRIRNLTRTPLQVAEAVAQYVRNHQKVAAGSLDPLVTGKRRQPSLAKLSNPSAAIANFFPMRPE